MKEFELFNIFKKIKRKSRIEPVRSFDYLAFVLSRAQKYNKKIVGDLVRELIDLKTQAYIKRINPTHYYISSDRLERLKAAKFKGEPLFKEMCLGMKYIVREGPLEVIEINEDT